MAGGGPAGADPAGSRTVTMHSRGTLPPGTLGDTACRLLVIVGVLAAWPVLHALLPDGLPAGVVLQGVVLGSLTGLSAVGPVRARWSAAP